MRVLHIGKKGNMERFSAPDSILRQADWVDMPMGRPVAEYLEQASDAEFIITDAIARIPRELICNMPRLKSIHSEGVAFNTIDLDAASSCHVLVCHSKGMNDMAVAEQTLLLMTGMLRNVIQNDRAVRDGRQIAVKEVYMQEGSLEELADCRIGLIGYGDIARCVARLLRGYGVKDIFYYKRHLLSHEEEERDGVRFMPLDELLSESDIVSLHLPVTPETKGMADHAFFEKMRPGSYLVNTARGELIEDEALVDALRSGRLAMAALDTLDHEPVQSDHPLLHLPEDIGSRLIFSPHIGGITASSFRRSYRMIAEDIQTVAEGRIPMRAVNPPRKGQMRPAALGEGAERTGITSRESEVERTLKMMMDAAPIGCYILRPNHTLLYWNREAERLLGFSASEMEGKRCVEMPIGCSFTSGDKIPNHYCPAIVAYTTGQPKSMQMFMRHKDGSDVLIRNTLVPLKDPDGKVRELVSFFIPLTDKSYDQDLIQSIYEMATRDPLTCLPGRKYMEVCLDEALEIFRRTGQPFAVLFADVNNFHDINNTYGHAVGDALLRSLGLALRKYGRKADKFCRWGGDEFVGLLHLRGPEEIEGAARRFMILANNCESVVDGQRVFCRSSIGITVVREGDTVQSLVSRADHCMYQAKKRTKDQLVTD